MIWSLTIAALINVALTSVAPASAAMTWSLTWSLTLLTLNNHGSDNAGGNIWIRALLGSEGDLVEPISPSVLPQLNLRSNESFILWIADYIILLCKWVLTSVALMSVAFTSVALTCAEVAWSLTRSLRTSLTIPALIKVALTSILWHDLTIPAVINVTEKCDSGMDCTLSGTSQHIIISLVLFGISEDIYSKFSTKIDCNVPSAVLHSHQCWLPIYCLYH